MTESLPKEDYRDSHAKDAYGSLYKKTYEFGYYRDQWEWIEKPLLNTVLRDVYDNGSRNCLDFACGTGRITSVLENIFPSVCGVDVSASMLEQARESCSTAELVQQDITLVPFDRAFQVVTAFRFFLNAQADLRQNALRAISDSLDADGCLIMNIHVNSSSILGVAYRIRNWVKRRVIANTCSYTEIETYLNAAGFEIESVFWYSYMPRIGWRLNRLSHALMMPVERFCRWFPLIPNSLAQSFLIVARKR